MRNITLSEILAAFEVNAIADIDLIPKKSQFKNTYHIIDDIKYLKASKSIGKLLSSLPLNSSSIAYRRKHSYFDFFKPHLKNNFYLRLDIKSFFHSIAKITILKSIESHISGPDGKDKYELSHAIANFLTIEHEQNEILPIGFPASPHVANLVFRTLDIQIQKLCLTHNIAYSRYSDDLLFSSATENVVHSDWFENSISWIISQKNFTLNKKKKIKAKNKISLNGYVISGQANNKSLSFSNERLKAIRKLIYFKQIKKFDDLSIMRRLFPNDIARLNLVYPNKNKFLKIYAKSQILNKIKGFRSYLLSLVNYGYVNNCIQSTHRELLIDLIKKLEAEILAN